MTIITRFAPSPTGDLHLGGARTALFNYALARSSGGRFLLRIEDTDASRNSDESSRGIVEAMNWLGLEWDGDITLQSDNKKRHKEVLRLLALNGAAYPAFETAEELASLREAGGRSWTYNGASAHLPRDVWEERIRSGEKHVWRLRTPDSGTFTVVDSVRGEVVTDLSTISDPIIWRSEGDAPLYNFACAIDDLDAGVTHVIRGEEHLPNAVVQSMVRAALGAGQPVWAHIPVVTRNGKRMSKRDKVNYENGPVGVLSRRDMGWTAEGVLNHLALLGWSRPDAEASETFTLEEFVGEFSLERVRRSPSNFDEKRARNFQKTWIRTLPSDVLAARVSSLTGREIPAAGVEIAKEKAPDLLSLGEMLRFLTELPEISDEGKEILARLGSDNLRAVADLAGNADTISWEQVLEACPGVTPKEAAAGIRMALTGKTVSPDLISVLSLLGDDGVMRLRSAADSVDPGPSPS